MKRRTLLKSAAVIATSSFFAPGAAAHQFSEGNSFTANINRGGLQKFGDGRDWFFESRYGMFVHWGLYSIPGWHEQHQWRAKVPRGEYMKLADQWNPKKFDPYKWLDLMQEAGMKYITLTTKHHDGFCLWDTRQTAFNTMNTPYRKDIVALLSDACHERKIPLCLYYSIADWNNPSYPNMGRHHELPPQRNDSPNWDKYMLFLKEQVRELCTNYGEIHGFWWDMNVPDYKDPEVNAMIRKLQPKAVINNRGFDLGDYGTPERDFDTTNAVAKELNKRVEACQSVGVESWGYKKDEDFYTDQHLISSIDRYLSQGANYLLNVGPTSEGIIPPEASAILKRIGKWKACVDESFQEVEPDNTLAGTSGLMVTKRNRTLYIHFNKLPIANGLKIRPINILPIKATLLNTGKDIDCIVNLSPSDHISSQSYLRLRNLPVNEMANTVLVAKLVFDRPLEQITQVKNPGTDIELTK